MSQTVPSDRYLAGALAFMVHLLFFLVLLFSVSWKQSPDVPVYADLWRDLPSPQPVARAVPKPIEQPVPPPLKPVPPPPPPKPVVPEVAKPDIALKAARKRELEQKQEEEKRQRLAQVMKQAEQAKLAQEAKQLQARMAQEKLAAEQKQQAEAKARKNLDAMLNAQVSQEINQESRDLTQQAQSQARSKLVADYVSRIRQKIRGLVRLPPNLQGNPEVVFKVDLLPDGEVIKVTQVRSSKQTAYDHEVERAIWKASPLPLPPDREVAAAFRSNLELKFRPYEK